jgi:hypothetical protein
VATGDQRGRRAEADDDRRRRDEADRGSSTATILAEVDGACRDLLGRVDGG